MVTSLPSQVRSSPAIRWHSIPVPLAQKPDATSKLPLAQQAVRVLNLFEKTKTVADFKEASAQWAMIKPELQMYDKKNECEKSGANDDKALAKDIVKDLVDAPIFLLIAVAELTIHISAGEQDESFKAVKDIWDELKDYGEVYSGAVTTSLSVFFYSTKITPEWCGLLRVIDDAQGEALRRIVPLANLSRTTFLQPFVSEKEPTLPAPQ